MLPPPIVPNSNTFEYSWKNARFRLANGELVGIEGFKLDEDTEREYIKGAGDYTVAIGDGQTEIKGSLTLHMKTQVRLAALTPTGRLQDLPPMELIANFHTPTENYLVTIFGVTFKGTPLEMKVGDQYKANDIEFLATHTSRVLVDD